MTIREHVGDSPDAPQYSPYEANQLITEYADRVQLEGQLIESDIRHFGQVAVDNKMIVSTIANYGATGQEVDCYQDMSLDTLRDSVDWALCSVT